jgi:nicotinate-nucleotide pyrophosphorylase (carboxylating)
MGHVDPPVHAVWAAVAAALAEDLTPLGDLTASLLDDDLTATADFVPRTDGVLAGTACATAAFRQLDERIAVTWSVHDGDRVGARTVVGTVSGPLAPLLSGERTALNFLCHLSGIATLTRRFVDAAAGGGARVWDTRKTTPGLRSLEKAAVRAGGGASHRGNLSEWVMLKDNHLTRLGIAGAIALAKERWPGRTVQVEVERLEQLAEALEAGADAVLLDNMTVDEATEAAAFATNWAASRGGRRPLVECSGGINLETVAAYAATGVDLLSTSAITQSAPALDIGLDIRPG